MPYQKKTLRKRAAIDMDNSLEDEAEMVKDFENAPQMHDASTQTIMCGIFGGYIFKFYFIFIIIFTFIIYINIS